MSKYDQQQKEQIVKRLVFDNPWWSTGKIADDYDSMPRRPYIDLFYPIVADLSTQGCHSHGAETRRKDSNDLSHHQAVDQ